MKDFYSLKSLKDLFDSFRNRIARLRHVYSHTIRIKRQDFSESLRRFPMLRFLGMPVLPALSAVISVCLYGCSSPVGSYQSHDIKSGSLQMDRLSVQAAQYHGPLRNPVIVIHGFLGSRLLEKESGMEIWGTFSNRLPSSYVLARLAHPMKYGIPLKNISDGTQAFSLMDIVRIRVMGFPFSMHGYKNLVDMLENYGYLPEKSEYQESDPPPSLFIFFYDWRRDAVENAARLSRFIEEKHQFLCRKYQTYYGLENPSVHFDIMAHSMGGIIARYYIRYGSADLPENPEELPPITWAGSKYVDKLFLVGTPNAGYLDTLKELTQGLHLAPGAPVYPPEILATFPSIYQMLPYPHLQSVSISHPDYTQTVYPDLYDPDVWIRYRWGLASENSDEILKILLPDIHSAEERRAVAIDHLKKCLQRARQLSRALSQPDSQNPLEKAPVFQGIFVGDSIQTARTAVIDPETGRLSISSYDSGDGKIPAVSARFDTRPYADESDTENWQPYMESPIHWDCVIHIRGAHMGITQAEDFVRNARFYLLQYPTDRQLQRIQAFKRKVSMPQVPSL